MSLIRAAEKFNYLLGNKFSTYASWAIMKNFARTIPNEFRHRDRFRTSLEEAFILVDESSNESPAIGIGRRESQISDQQYPDSIG